MYSLQWKFLSVLCKKTVDIESVQFFSVSPPTSKNFCAEFMHFSRVFFSITFKFQKLSRPKHNRKNYWGQSPVPFLAMLWTAVDIFKEKRSRNLLCCLVLGFFCNILNAGIAFKLCIATHSLWALSMITAFKISVFRTKADVERMHFASMFVCHFTWWLKCQYKHVTLLIFLSVLSPCSFDHEWKLACISSAGEVTP